VVGFALTGGGTNWSLANGLGGGSSDAFQLGFYGATRAGAAYLAGGFAYTSHWLSTDRLAFAGDHLTAQFNAQSFGARVEGGYRFAKAAVGITPYAAVQAQSFRTPSYSETDVNGGGFGLTFNARTATDTRSELGARFDYVVPFLVYQSAVLTLRGRLAWAHDWVSDPSLRRVPGAAGRELHRQRRGTGEGRRARLRRRRAAPRQRRHDPGQVRRRVRQPRADLCWHRHRALDVVATSRRSKGRSGNRVEFCP
jgi:outer membrane autotransporter protein